MEYQISLGGAWTWCEAGSGVMHPGQVPGSVMTDMLANGLIEDPYWRTNEY